MTRAPMQPRDRRAMLLGLAILVPALGWVYGVRPALATISGLNDQITSEREALSRERAAIVEATRNPMRKRVADSAMAAARLRVFTASSDVAAGATLVTYLGDVARRTHVWLANATTRPTSAAGSPSSRVAPVVRTLTAQAGGRGASTSTAEFATVEGLRPLRVDLTAESDFQGVLDFLQALERGQKIVTVERLDVARTIRAGEDDRETLRITATVVGYTLDAGRGGP